MDTDIRRLVPIPEARQILGGIGHSTVYELVKRGEITKVNIGRRGFITAESIRAYIDRLCIATPTVAAEQEGSRT
ncbi:helix-turn-helix domain-containing protein [Mycobacteroides chelonae]|jgi:predicted DNA-binding transcriptional regulator AlpA|uniref:DNA-binding protein n=1 Tax=Mycobacteroides chelonae TaxID=1774 RepID=A0A1S1M0V0_MYCCH|nr:helix-turn-helix domain-containing protein [Mycobacteroides chelonae]MBF9315817.1 helix-turn-helix domain-containing protein [Mycobacteroides chelonae]OHT68264.1 DNA-binding protein [Mycobacteroides chelonae]OHT75722.1 DNA-binding protein [Mycobacteroides chelonae]OHT87328.1 DNA-binding protein [Mycobacteroides chelonae]OHU77042.1 DNA-binding protein [Mycobacteroides chelonae]